MLNWNNPKFTKQTVLKESPALITIDHVTIFDGTGVDAYENGRILIKDGQFIAVGKKETVEIPAESYIIDGTDMTALPGLIDAHIHLSDSEYDSDIHYIINSMKKMKIQYVQYC